MPCPRRAELAGKKSDSGRMKAGSRRRAADCREETDGCQVHAALWPFFPPITNQILQQVSGGQLRMSARKPPDVCERPSSADGHDGCRGRDIGFFAEHEKALNLCLDSMLFALCQIPQAVRACMQPNSKRYYLLLRTVSIPQAVRACMQLRYGGF